LKDTLVSNARLSRAAVESGLDQFIITAPVVLTKWRPSYVEDMLNSKAQPATRELSTKTLADVVEAVIGVAFLSGGLSRALSVMTAFLPEQKWQDLRLARQVLWDAAPPDSTLSSTLFPVEKLIGYVFRRKSLLVDAMTHASYNALGTTGCLERLEFIGDAVLDNLVVTKLWEVQPTLSHVEMHLLRTALVNGDFLGFLVMEWSTKTREIHVNVENTVAAARVSYGKSPQVTNEALEASDVTLPLWSFMRHSNPAMAVAQQATAIRHARIRDSVIAALDHGETYPWALLARLQAQKFYSDLFESVLGAVWIDSDCSEAICEGILERSGLLPYMRRILRDRIHIWHPKEELGRLADREKVKYDVSERQLDGMGRGEMDKEFLCKVFIGNKLIAEVNGGIGKEEIRTKAAEEAVRKMKAQRSHDAMSDA
jgi:dsRNA-specific ribonuclease